MSESCATAHIPGSFPAKNAELAMHAQMLIGNEYVEYVSDGETGDRKNWVVAQIEGYRNNPAFKLAKDGGWSSYEDCPEFAAADGHVLTPEDFNLQYAAHAKAAWPMFAKMRQEQGLSDLQFQFDVPSGLDLTYFTFGLARGSDPALQEVAIAATQQEIQKMRNFVYEDPQTGRRTYVGDQIVPSISTPLSGSMGLIPPEHQPPGLRVPDLAQALGELVSGTPEDTAFGIHLCVGDLGNEARGQLTRPASVALMNEIAKNVPDNRRLAFVTDPMAAGTAGPSMYAEDYEALRGLKLPTGTRYIAGMVHGDLDQYDPFRVQGLIMGNLPEQQSVGWGPNCGLGRDDVKTATKILRLSAQLAMSTHRS